MGKFRVAQPIGLILACPCRQKLDGVGPVDNRPLATFLKCLNIFFFFLYLDPFLNFLDQPDFLFKIVFLERTEDDYSLSMNQSTR